jgi:hypothetical protein
MDTPLLRLFISHAHEDKQLARALKELIEVVFPPGAAQSVRVDFSSDDAVEGGVTTGVAWLDWIRTVVQQADACVVLLTADSISAPWVTWEAGAVSGVAIGSVSHSTVAQTRAAIVPVLFGIGIDAIPAPLQHQQAVNGEKPEEVRKLLFSLHKLSKSTQTFQEGRTRRPVTRFIRHVQDFRLTRLRERPAAMRLPARSSIFFVNDRNGLTLEPRDGEIANGVRLECGTFTGDAHQRWHAYPVDTLRYKVVMDNTKHCISVENDSLKPGATIFLWEYVGHDTQHWRFETSLRTVRIVNCASGLCLEPTRERQIVQAKIENYKDEDWWILATPTMETQ